ncbi:secretion protein HlyD [Richelia sinica FACHB-800]|uniref:Secretion protein HlyD n=1 Tax=Richelia sinica FACHB-800 TaxID=1357546 RepID=A0A975Y3M2_9NOST|nr:ABC exporter membrane fusion protein [Richelia sinica FACHB-800]QXE22275.1 secretion protein HlyD [Richelia sinica FACHB-800]
MQNHKLQSSFLSSKSLRLPISIALIASLTVFGISVVTIVRFRDVSNQKVSEPIEMMPEIKTVTALGKIEPQGEVIKVAAAASSEGSRVEKLMVQEGDRVKIGQVIAILDSRDRLAATLQEAEEEVKVAQANLEKILAGAKQGKVAAQKAAIDRIMAESQGEIETQTANIARFKAELLNAQIQDKRYQKLYAEGAISSAQRDSQRLILETAQINLNSAQAQLKQIHRTNKQKLKQAAANLQEITEIRTVDVAAAEAEVRRTQAAVKTAQTNLQQAYVRSPQSGQVFEINTHPGELITNDGIADIGQTSQMYVVAEIYESDITKIRSGQQVKVFSDVLPEELQGTVEKIGLQVKRQNLLATDPSSNIDNRVVKVKIRLDQTASQKAAKFTNMQVKVVIEI